MAVRKGLAKPRPSHLPETSTAIVAVAVSELLEQAVGLFDQRIGLRRQRQAGATEFFLDLRQHLGGGFVEQIVESDTLAHIGLARPDARRLVGNCRCGIERLGQRQFGEPGLHGIGRQRRVIGLG